MLQALSWLTIVQHHTSGGWWWVGGGLFILHRHYRRHTQTLLAHFEFKESEEIRLEVLFFFLPVVVLFAPTLFSIPPSSQSQFCCRVPAP